MRRARSYRLIAGGLWANGVASEWSAELSDSREDIYTLDDGQPVNAAR